MAMIIGGALGTWLIAAILFFFIRKISRLSDIPAYAIGFVIAAPLASVLYSFNNEHLGLGPFDMLPTYGIGAVIGFVAVVILFKFPTKKHNDPTAQ